MPSPTSALTSRQRLEQVSRLLSGYLLQGDRAQYVDALPLMIDEVLRAASSNDQMISESARTFWKRATDYVERISVSDAILNEWLCAHRIGFGYDDQGSDALLLFVSHIRDVLAAEHRPAPNTHPLMHFESMITRPANALVGEIIAAMRCNAASIAFARASMQTSLT